MKPKLILSMLFAFIVASNCRAQLSEAVDTFTIPANKAYAEPYSEGEPGVSIPVGNVGTKDIVSNWRNADKSVVWYLYQKSGSYDFYFNSTVNKSKNLEFEVIITPCSKIEGFKNISKKITFKGTGQAGDLFVTNVNIPETSYFRYELKPITPPESAIKIQSLVFKSLKPDGKVNETEYQSSPSVHLSFSTTAPTSKNYNWIYQEILVPNGSDPLATYYMSLGFFRGYMGIQTNSSTERRVLFSVWDGKDAENDKSISKQDYVSFVDKGAHTTVNSFGGEGTGGQSYVKRANWQTGKPVKFLMNIQKQANNSVILSAWYKVDNQNWAYVASWRAPKEQRMFDGFYSFLENFGYPNGQLRREAYYYNAYGKDATSGNWLNFNKVRFSHTDGKVGQRVDYEQGVAKDYPDRFYMSSGGYTPTLQTENQIPLNTREFKLDLKPFEDRVALALKNEKANQGKMKKN